MPSIFHQLLQIQTKNQSIAVDIAIFGGLIICGLSLIFIFFFVIFRQRQNNLVNKQKIMREEFEKQLLQAQLEIQEQTFNNISGEIHDNVGQILSLVKVQLNIIDQSEILDKTLLGYAKDSVSVAMRDLRDISKSLSAERIQLLSLFQITGHELERINRVGLMSTSIELAGKEQDVQSQKKLIVFRIIQEALQNILKHSKANKIDTNFHYEREHLRIEISDNGVGFEMDFLKSSEGLGLRNIINRAALIGGEARINSIINIGTNITIISPYD